MDSNKNLIQKAMNMRNLMRPGPMEIRQAAQAQAVIAHQPLQPRTQPQMVQPPFNPYPQPQYQPQPQTYAPPQPAPQQMYPPQGYAPQPYAPMQPMPQPSYPAQTVAPTAPVGPQGFVPPPSPIPPELRPHPHHSVYRDLMNKHDKLNPRR